MARRLTAAERREYAEQAVSLSSRGVSIRKISERLGIARGTVASLLKEALAELDPGVDASRAEALEHYRQVIALCWQRINASGKELAGGGFVPLMHPHAMTGLLNTALAAQDKSNRLRAVVPPEHMVLEHKTLRDRAIEFDQFARETEGLPRSQRLRVVD